MVIQYQVSLIQFPSLGLIRIIITVTVDAWTKIDLWIFTKNYHIHNFYHDPHSEVTID